MAAGCLVVGYHGHGGKEYFDPSYCYPVEQGDILEYVHAVEKALKTFESDADRFQAWTSAARAMVQERYNTHAQRTDVSRVFGEALARARGFDASPQRLETLTHGSRVRARLRPVRKIFKSFVKG